MLLLLLDDEALAVELEPELEPVGEAEPELGLEIALDEELELEFPEVGDWEGLMLLLLGLEVPDDGVEELEGEAEVGEALARLVGLAEPVVGVTDEPGNDLDWEGAADDDGVVVDGDVESESEAEDILVSSGLVWHERCFVKRNKTTRTGD